MTHTPHHTPRAGLLTRRTRNRRIIGAVVVIGAGAFLAGAFTSEAVGATSSPDPLRTVLLAELHDCRDLPLPVCEIDPPTRLDVFMWSGEIAGESVDQRCADMGGTFTVRVTGASENLVCEGVDY